MPDSTVSSQSEPSRPRAPVPLPPQLPLGGTAPADLPPAPASRVPSSPPPTYEEVLAENRLAAAQLARAASLEATSSGCSSLAGGSGSGGSGRAKSSSTPAVMRADSAPASALAAAALAAGRAELPMQHKSSKALYRAMAAQWGITCKMSDKCRCFDCQGRYFDYDYEQNEQNKQDGGLGATTPMFISEVMGGTACTLL